MFAAPIDSVPAVTDAPQVPLFVPLKVSVPAPFLVSVLLPLIAPERVTAAALVMVPVELNEIF